MSDNILEIKNLSKSFGGVKAVDEIQLTVPYGQRRLIIGTNGAGKTTLFNMICGDFKASSGSISIFGKSVDKLSTRNRMRLGMRRTYQTSALFDGLTVRQNMFLAALGNMPMLQQFRMFTSAKKMSGKMKEIDRSLTALGLEQRAEDKACDLSHGERRQLELAQAMLPQPKLLMLDEPFAGLSAEERASVSAFIQKIQRDVTIILIEHDLDIAFSIADYVTVMYNGKIVAEGSVQEIRTDPYIQEIYMGGKKDADAGS